MSFKSVKRAGGGDCFVVALENVMADRNLYVCHGIVHGQGPLIGLVYPHAWNETDDGYVIDQSNGNDIYMPKSEYYSIGKIDESTVKRYDFYEAARKAVDTGIYGPWDSSLDFEYREAGRMKEKRKTFRRMAAITPQFVERYEYDDGESEECYQVGEYEVTAEYKNDVLRRFSIMSPFGEKYLPEIYYRNDSYGRGDKDFEIQTTSYGAMSVGELRQVIDGLEYAIEVVEELKVLQAELLRKVAMAFKRKANDESIDISNKWAKKADYDVVQKAWEIAKRMSLVYEDMYDNKWMNQEDVENGDKLLRALSGSDILNNILQERGDIISFDREVAAFWIAFNGVMDHMGEHLIRNAAKRTKKAFEDEIELVIDGEYCDGYVYLSHDSDHSVITCDTEVECWGDNGVDTIETYFECPDNWNAVDIAYDIAQQVEFEYGADLGIDMARFTNTIATELQYIVKESKRKARIVMTAKQRAERLVRKAAKRTKRAFIEWQPVSGGYGLYEYDDGEYLFMMQEPDSSWGETAYILDVFDSNNPNKQIVDTEEFDSKEDLENFIIERRFGSKQAAMTRDDILDAIAMFAQSQGSYGRMLEALEEMREYDPDRYEAIMSAWEAEGFNDIVDFVMYIEGSRKARRNTKRASKKTAYAEVPVNSASSSDFDYLYSQSALTWEGMSSDKGNLDAIFEAFQEAGAEPKNSLRFYEITGQAMNEHYGLTGSNAYPDDLTILSIPLEDFDKGSALVMWRMQVGARWFDDVVDNNERREMGW